jgi:hypothetical protein
MDNPRSQRRRINLRQGLGDGIANHDEVQLDFASGIRTSITLEFSGDSFGANASLAVARDRFRKVRPQSYIHFGMACGSEGNVRVKRIICDHADVAETDGIRAALRLGRRRGEEQQSTTTD